MSGRKICLLSEKFGGGYFRLTQSDGAAVAGAADAWVWSVAAPDPPGISFCFFIFIIVRARVRRRTRKPAASRHLHRWRVLCRRSAFIQGRTGSSESLAPAHYQLMHFWSWLAHTRTHTPTCGRWLAGPALSLFVLIKPGMKLQASLYRSAEPSINKTSPAVIFNMTQFYFIFF